MPVYWSGSRIQMRHNGIESAGADVPLGHDCGRRASRSVPPQPTSHDAPIKVVSQRIGHADPAVTMQVYAHALDGDDATAAEITATAIFGDA
jgi:integrase